MRPKFLDDFTGEYRPSGEQRNYRRCPVCGGTAYKLYVDPVSGRWICFAGGCKAAGRVHVGDGVASLRERLFARKRGVPEFEPIEMPETNALTEQWSKMLCARYHLEHPERYLLRRGTGDLAGRIVIPYADRKGDFIFWNARTTCGETPKYLAMTGAKPLYVPDYVHRKWCEASRIVLVEGPFDALSLHDRFSTRAVALGGTSISDAQFAELRRLVTVDGAHKAVRILLDSAALGEAIKLKRKLAGLLPQHDVQIRQLPAGVKDPAAASAAQLEGCLQ